MLDINNILNHYLNVDLVRTVKLKLFRFYTLDHITLILQLYLARKR